MDEEWQIASIFTAFSGIVNNITPDKRFILRKFHFVFGVSTTKIKSIINQRTCPHFRAWHWEFTITEFIIAWLIFFFSLGTSWTVDVHEGSFDILIHFRIPVIKIFLGHVDVGVGWVEDGCCTLWWIELVINKLKEY